MNSLTVSGIFHEKINHPPLSGSPLHNLPRRSFEFLPSLPHNTVAPSDSRCLPLPITAHAPVYPMPHPCLLNCGAHLSNVVTSIVDVKFQQEKIWTHAHFPLQH